jgi:DNA-binding transcriptional regulator LsrR (DeoR family)
MERFEDAPEENDMPRSLKPTELAQIATLFFKEGLKKAQIAARYGVDPHIIAEAIETAKDLNIVQIIINQTPKAKLEQQMRDKYPHLRRVMIARGTGRAGTTVQQTDLLFRQFGALAASYFQEIVELHPQPKPLHIGVTGGSRLLEFANAVETADRERVHVHAAALVGRGPMNDSTAHIEPSVPASILWTHCGSHPQHCHYVSVEPYHTDKLPGPQTRTEVREYLRSLADKPYVRKALEETEQLDVVFAGFGFLHSRETRREIENRTNMNGLLEGIVVPNEIFDEGAIGDFCYCPFNSEGDTRHDKDWNFFLTAGHHSPYQGIEFYKYMVEAGKTVVGIGGPNLTAVIKAALKGKIVNTLILDESTAEELVYND